MIVSVLGCTAKCAAAKYKATALRAAKKYSNALQVCASTKYKKQKTLLVAKLDFVNSNLPTSISIGSGCLFLHHECRLASGTPEPPSGG